ncbi:MAG: hypothetical protein KBT36_01795 [Kurthia sp.]|nr:hypothetical protein [Candidatus Kurthia equi]
MKDRNTIVFFLFIGILLILFACLAPLYSSGMAVFITLVGVLHIILAGYTTLITQFRGKSAFTVVKEPKAQPAATTQELPLKQTLQTFPAKRF